MNEFTTTQKLAMLMEISKEVHTELNRAMDKMDKEKVFKLSALYESIGNLMDYIEE